MISNTVDVELYYVIVDLILKNSVVKDFKRTQTLSKQQSSISNWL